MNSRQIEIVATAQPKRDCGASARELCDRARQEYEAGRPAAALPLLRRAAELGMSYAAYAKCRQATGHDILALLFSSNALRVIGPGAEMPDAEARALEQVRAAKKLTLVHRPAEPGAVLQANPVLDAAGAAPRFTESWSQMRDRVQGFIREQGMPARQVLIIGDAPLEEDWSTAAQACGYLRSSEYFAHQ